MTEPTLTEIADQLDAVIDRAIPAIRRARTIGALDRRDQTVTRMRAQLRHIQSHTVKPSTALLWLKTATATVDAWEQSDLDALHADRADRRGL